MISIRLKEKVGSFAENKDVARDIRMNIIIPALEKGEMVTLDFQGIDSATQSFVHALISDLIRKYGGEVIEKISFKSCNEVIRKIITIVIDYMQESSN
ncbi:MAG: STAS-like domain-containing protein [Patescibacteria group bacterium]